MTQKVKQKASLTDDEAEALTLERMRSDMSSESGIGTASIIDDESRPALTRENTSLSLNDAIQREKSNISQDSGAPSSRAEVQSGRGGRNRKDRGKKRQLDDLDLRKISIGETLEELEEEEIGAPTTKELRLARADSLLYFRKPSVWSYGREITPEVLRDLEKTANMTRFAESLLPDYLQADDEVKMVTPEPQKGPVYTEEQLKSLTPWERFLLTKKPIIAPDGYIPNSVVRRAIGFVKPESPMLPWHLKPHQTVGYFIENDSETQLYGVAKIQGGKNPQSFRKRRKQLLEEAAASACSSFTTIRFQAFRSSQARAPVAIAWSKLGQKDPCGFQDGITRHDAT
ncbi:hypothetical protein PoB_002940800 [Plakobranchus ocellatus]|uniref:Uncharacterized protein n=1 Tax=Plakobranchus ocellatus TaxID=259542 RepID=A0AAV4A6S7_9GAST|nr:hypothetical protein PoB_002940800 [Plakobranchus ocellatus]